MSGAFGDETIIVIFFFYGLAFYSLGLALLVESGRASELGFARSMRLLAGFGLLHGFHEWFDMTEHALTLYYDHPVPTEWVWLRLGVLASSFVALLAFGEQLLVRERYGNSPNWYRTTGAIGLFAIASIGVQIVYRLDDVAWAQAVDVLTRYTLGILGTVLTCFALWEQRVTFQKRGMRRFVFDLDLAVIAFFLYGVVGQIFNGESVFFPSNIINSTLFRATLGFPIQLFRSAMAAIVAFSMIRVLRVLEVENEERLNAIQQAKVDAERRSREELLQLNRELQAANAETARLLDEVQRRDELRGELLQRITNAQESERKRIARELHDGTGQALTGLALGLRGIVNMIDINDECDGVSLRQDQLRELEAMATTSLGELRGLIDDLRPPQLDDMGLVAALRWQVDKFVQRTGIQADVTVIGKPEALPSEVETTLFRIVQEGLTNIAKHAHADRVKVTLNFEDGLELSVWDNGIGFDSSAVFESHSPRTAWGLLGMQERASLINALLTFDSMPGQGTTLTVRLHENNGSRGKL